MRLRLVDELALGGMGFVGQCWFGLVAGTELFDGRDLVASPYLVAEPGWVDLPDPADVRELVGNEGLVVDDRELAVRSALVV